VLVGLDLNQRPLGLTVNGQRLPESPSAGADSLGRSLPHPVWGRHVVGPDERWLVSTRVPNSWDSRYVGPFSVDQVRAVARPVWTVD
jgi:type IV secretory pathway protease TraF